MHHETAELANERLVAPISLIEGERFPALFLFALAALYCSFGILFGLISGTLPPLLRSKGLEMGQLGWLFVLFIPFGLTFLWSPMIDAFAPNRHMPKISWILCAQIVTVIVLFVTSYLHDSEPLLLLTLGIIVALATATMDLALDALASESVPEKHRPVAGAIKAGTYLIGLVVGGGILMALSDRLGWTVMFQLVAVFTIIASVPICFCTKSDNAKLTGKFTMPSFTKTFARPRNLRRLFALSLLSCVFSSMMGMGRIVLVDVGISLDTIGTTVGIFGPLVGLGASTIAVPLLNRLGNGQALVICLFYGLFTLSGLIIGLNGFPHLALVSITAMSAASSGLFVIMCTSLLGWAQGNQPATDYATLLGLSRLVGTVFMIGSSMLIPVIGWDYFYGFIMVLFIIATVIVIRILPEVFGLKRKNQLSKG
ncbi:Major facilitator superfamily [Bartonella choladocola]|uniref:MFS transporter n=1 Tax=Bartonella TaxID=773 RepID=UPI0018DDD9E2|nr:MFS transporter [Bartonella choladocola]MBI0140928.1 MFS transporter [Bartonella choladocola]